MPARSQQAIASSVVGDDAEDADADEAHAKVDEDVAALILHARRSDWQVLPKHARDDCVYSHRERRRRQHDLPLDHPVAHGVHVNVHKRLDVRDAVAQARKPVARAICAAVLLVGTECMNCSGNTEQQGTPSGPRYLRCYSMPLQTVPRALPGATPSHPWRLRNARTVVMHSGAAAGSRTCFDGVGLDELLHMFDISGDDGFHHPPIHLVRLGPLPVTGLHRRHSTLSACNHPTAAALALTGTAADRACILHMRPTARAWPVAGRLGKPENQAPTHACMHGAHPIITQEIATDRGRVTNRLE